MNRFVKTALLGSVSVAALFWPVAAQAQSSDTNLLAKPADPTAEAAPQASSDTGVEELGDIVVTGSRLRSEYNTATPVQIINAETARNAGAFDTAGIIMRSVAALGVQQVNNKLSATGAGGRVVDGGNNAQTVGLRNLGAGRTLVLLNGQRLTPAGTGSRVGQVDLNTLPSSMISRVEVLTGGASSIYGSDAIAGVVNIIPRKTSDGVELNLDGNVSEHGGGNYVQGALFWGEDFGQGTLTVAAEYRRQEALKNRQRERTSCAQDYVYDPRTGQRTDLLDTSGNIKCRNLNPTGIFFDYTWYGGWFQYAPGAAGASYPASALGLRNVLPDWVRTARGGFPETYTYGISDSPAYQNADSISPLSTGSLYVAGSYELAPDIEAYGNVLLNRRVSSSDTWQFLYPLLSPTNPNNTVAAGLIQASGGNSTGLVQPQMNMAQEQRQNVNYGQITAGVRGGLEMPIIARPWSWDVSGHAGRSDGEYSSSFFYADRLAAATAPGVACNAALISISGPTNCVSIPWLSKRFLVDQDWTDAERSFLQGRETGRTKYDQLGIDGSISGALFDLPTGSVDLATGFTIRYQALNDTPGYNARNGNYFASSTAGITKGSDTVQEVFGEIGVPLLADLPVVEKLTFTGSGRYTNYRSFGSDETYKAGLGWTVNNWVSLRASTGTSFRAPSLYELYLANQLSFYAYSDPCVRYGDTAGPTVAANCASQGFAPDFNPANNGITAVTGGGKGQLKAETSRNKSVGIVLTPAFADLSIAADYYSIAVRNEVASYGVGSIISRCYNSPTFPGNNFCARVTRDPMTRAITVVDDRLVNLAQQKQRGIDLSASFRQPLGFGDFGLNVQWNWVFENSLRRDENSYEDRNGLSGNPKTVGWVEANLKVEDLSFFYGFNFIGPTNDAKYYDGDNLFNYCGAYAGRTVPGNRNDCLQVAEKLTVGSYMTHYVSVRWQIEKDLSGQIGIINMFDKKPPVMGSDSYTYRTGSVPSNLYDLRGRTVSIRLGKTF
ncbi:TonB-dependent receptor plug domain-containing protein [Niveispirillum lacus]|nr:TonB-dependent receptor [Niveispirillum lacus]